MWRRFSCSPLEAKLSILLECGQSFRWRKLENARTELSDPVWAGVLRKKVWFLKQDQEHIHFKTIPQCSLSEQHNEEFFLKEYLQLHVDVAKLYAHWAACDKHFSKLKETFCGLRILRQDPVENLFSFICSQNNNIVRISQLVEKLCRHFGDFIVEIEGVQYFTFPTVAALAGADVESKLRELGFGYRAKFIRATAKVVVESGGESWLHSLRSKDYEVARSALCQLPGVGLKVADCVCLMSLDKPSAVPVDTHMWEVALRDYLPQLRKNKTLTDKTYKEIGYHFQALFGPYAGWAQAVLFSADLKRFKHVDGCDGSANLQAPQVKTKTSIKSRSRKSTASTTVRKRRKTAQ